MGRHSWRVWVGMIAVITSALAALPAQAGEPPDKTPAAVSSDAAEANRLEKQVVRLHALGKDDEALPLAERALALYEKALGPDHTDVATSLNNLAELHRNKGSYALAEPLYKRSLAIREKALGPDHADVATSLNNLALLYKTKADYARAEPLYNRALSIVEKAFGPEHPYAAASLNNLANLHYDKGDYPRAELLFRRALAIREKALGPDHPHVARSLNDLAKLYWYKADYARAEPLIQRAITISEKALGPSHPDVATSLNILGNVSNDTGSYARAEALYKRALAIWEKALGPDHPDVAQFLNTVAVLYKSKGDLARAEPLFQRAQAIRERASGVKEGTAAEAPPPTSFEVSPGMRGCACGQAGGEPREHHGVWLAVGLAVAALGRRRSTSRPPPRPHEGAGLQQLPRLRLARFRLAGLPRLLVVGVPLIAACAGETDPSGPEEPRNYAASDPCSVSPQAGCPADHTCIVVTFDGATTCQSAGSAPLGGDCGLGNNCAPGLVCVGNICHAFCQEPADCDGIAQACLNVALGDTPVKNWNVCSISCNPVEPQTADSARGTLACPEGMGCFSLDPSVGPQGSTTCYPAGEAKENAPCKLTSDCAPGLACVGGNINACRRLCILDESACECLSFGESFYAAIADEITEIGYCE